MEAGAASPGSQRHRAPGPPCGSAVAKASSTPISSRKATACCLQGSKRTISSRQDVKASIRALTRLPGGKVKALVITALEVEVSWAPLPQGLAGWPSPTSPPLSRQLSEPLPSGHHQMATLKSVSSKAAQETLHWSDVCSGPTLDPADTPGVGAAWLSVLEQISLGKSKHTQA